MKLPNEFIIQHSTRPMVENLSTCYIIRFPKRKQYNIAQQNIVLAFSQNCLNDIFMGDGLTFVMPSGVFFGQEFWDELRKEFGEFVYVEKVC